MSCTARLIASDMDGTLLNNNHRLSEKTMHVLCELMFTKGVEFIFATGRHCIAVETSKEDLVNYMKKYMEAQLKTNPSPELAATWQQRAKEGFYIVSSNGARVHDPSGNLVIEHNIDPDIVSKLYLQYGLPHTYKKKNCPPQKNEVVSISAYTTEVWYMSSNYYAADDIEKKFGLRPFIIPYGDYDDANRAAVAKEIENLNDNEKQLFSQLNDLHSESVFDHFPIDRVGKLCFRSHDIPLLERLERDFKKQFGDKISVAFSSDNCLDLMKGNVSKANAIREVIDVINAKNKDTSRVPLDISEVVAFGDSMNDKEMLADVGKGFIMINAQPRLKSELLTEKGGKCVVTEFDNEQDGVARILSSLFSL